MLFFGAVFRTMGSAMKGAARWIAKRVATWIGWQIFLWASGAGIAWMIVTLQDDIAAAIRDYNERIMARVFSGEDMVFRMTHNVFERVDAILSEVEARIVSALDRIMPEQIDIILRAVNFAGWVDALTSEIADAAGNAVADTVSAATAPVLGLMRAVSSRVESAWRAVEAVGAAVDAAAEQINAKIDELFERLRTGVDGINGRIDGLFSRLTTMADAFNASVDAIRALVEDAETRVNAEVQAVYGGVANPVNDLLDAHNARVDGLAESLQALLDRFNADVLEIKGKVEAGEPIEDWDAYRYQLADVGIDLDAFRIDYRVPALEWRFEAGIDFESYRIALSDFGLDREAYRIALSDFGLDREDFRFEIDIPGLDAATAEIRLAYEDVCDAERAVEFLPGDVREAFMSMYPAFLRTNLEERIKQFLIIAITRALLQKQAELTGFMRDFRGDIQQMFEDAKRRIIAETDAAREWMYEMQMELINSLPEILRPALAKQVEKIKEQVIRAQEQILVNVDQFLIDTATVDRILQRLDPYEARTEPLKFDTREWELQDMYRILVNYFWRHERMALAVLIASQDMQIETEELKGLMEENTR